MISYLYDGTYTGLLSCLHDALRTREIPQDIVDGQSFAAGLFDRVLHIQTQPANVAWTRALLRARLSIGAESRLFRAFLADVAGREMSIYRYVRQGLVHGTKLDNRLTDPAVKAVHELTRVVGCEAHRLKGFVRFQELTDGQFYAAVEPDHFVLPLVAGFFSRRLPGRAWIIHDTRRQVAAVHERGSWSIVGFQIASPPAFSAAEWECRRLWRDYFQRIAIDSRKNQTLQQQYVPLRYRPFMVEFTPDKI